MYSVRSTPLRRRYRLHYYIIIIIWTYLLSPSPLSILLCDMYQKRVRIIERTPVFLFFVGTSVPFFLIFCFLPTTITINAWYKPKTYLYYIIVYLIRLTRSHCYCCRCCCCCCCCNRIRQMNLDGYRGDTLHLVADGVVLKIWRTNWLLRKCTRTPSPWP